MYLDIVATWPEERQEDWAARKMQDITDAHTLALHIAGWKIIRDDGLGRWPFDATHCTCPEWCADMATDDMPTVDYSKLLSDRDLEIIKTYQAGNTTLRELGRVFNLSHERIRQIVAGHW